MAISLLNPGTGPDRRSEPCMRHSHASFTCVIYMRHLHASFTCVMRMPHLHHVSCMCLLHTSPAHAFCLSNLPCLPNLSCHICSSAFHVAFCSSHSAASSSSGALSRFGALPALPAFGRFGRFGAEPLYCLSSCPAFFDKTNFRHNYSTLLCLSSCPALVDKTNFRHNYSTLLRASLSR